jgi:O-antigen/teichoic acid export membrane protein
MCAALYLIGPLLITLFYSTRFISSIAPFKILLVGIVAMSGWRILSNDLYGRGLPMINTYISAASIFLSVVLNIIMIPRFGINGAAWATSISYLTSFAAIVVVYRKISDNRFKDILFVNVSDIHYYVSLFFIGAKKLLIFGSKK